MSKRYITPRWLLARALRETGYDGLCQTDGECGCTVEDLAPCDEPPWFCEPARNDPDRAEAEGLDFWMVPVEEEGSDV